MYRMNSDWKQAAETMQWIASVFWFLDIPASFFTAVYVNDQLRFRMKEIALHYLKSWCVFDCLMLASDVVVPWSISLNAANFQLWITFILKLSNDCAQVLILEQSDMDTAGVLRVARTRRLFRLLRLFQTIRLWKVLQAEMFW